MVESLVAVEARERVDEEGDGEVVWSDIVL